MVTVAIGGSMAAELAWAEPPEPPEPPVRLPISLAPAASEDSVVVIPGDHLWKISERRLGEVLRRVPSDVEVSPYWRDVISANRASLRSGDPDLIYPGERVELPSVNR